MRFEKDFVWGAATASYQVEGAAYEDGKGRNIWDVFSSEPGNVYEGHTGDVACDQYHHFREDVALMKEIGVKAYRFSVSWARILPDGTGAVNEKGIAYYNMLIDELLRAGIEPYMTLYHWDLPYELHKRGGWLNPDIENWFYSYAKLIAQRFSDRVKHFFTINEPQCVIGLGYERGIHAPGLKLGPSDYFTCWHNLLKAHGRAVEALRKYSHGEVKIGMAACGGVCAPATDDPADVEAARKAMFSLGEKSLEVCSWDVALCLDPVYKGQYPEDIMSAFGQYFPKIRPEDMEVISQPLDFHGQNIYNSITIRADENGNPVRVTRCPGFPRTANGWPVTPESLYWGPKFLQERYHKPIYITENGLSSHDWISVDGEVHDSSRIDFLRRYLLEVGRAKHDGVDIRGYFLWSLLDNFEWNEGYKERFGMIYVDYETQKRIRKDSSYFYEEVIASAGEALSSPRRTRSLFASV